MAGESYFAAGGPMGDPGWFCANEEWFINNSNVRSVMKITSAEFLKSVVDPAQLPKDPLPHIAFVGRSNVGKSSLINSLLQRKKLALTSATPGKTSLLNFFLINRAFYFVDFPGYGFARRSREERSRWGSLTEAYLQNELRLKAVVLLIDLRHGLSEDDRDFLAWLRLHDRRVIVVFTKADKLKTAERTIKLNEYSSTLPGVAAEDQVVYSVVKAWGREELWRAINALI